jgi:putative ABC transport system permease protein
VHAIVLVARAELRRHWLSLLVIGLMAGLAGGALASASALARRTATADDRLHAATNADDVRTLMIGGDAESTEAIGERALALPGVVTGRVALGGVARVSSDQIVYVSLMVGPDRWGDDVLSPVLVDGRLPDPARPDEVVLDEAMADEAPEGFELGREVELRFLTVEEYTQWDASAPLEGKAGTQSVEIVGTVRHPGAGGDLPPLIGTPALAELVPDGIGVLGAALLQLEDGADAAAVREAVNEAGRSIDRPAIVADLPPMVSAGSSQQLRASTQTTTDVITLGLVVLAAMAALAGVLAVAQASIRHSSASGEEQSVQQAIGMTVGQRIAARLLAAGPALALAGGLTLAVGLATAAVEPPGVLRHAEPHPGRAPNALLLIATGLAVVVTTAGLLAASTAWSSGGRRRLPPAREAPLVSRIAALGARPPTVVGLRFALERSGRTGGGRATIVATTLTLAGIVACLTYGSSLQRVERTPLRFGWPTDLMIADAGPALVQQLAADDRFEVVLSGFSADLRIDGQAFAGLSLEPVEGEVTWHLASGRPPATPDEIVLGTRVAEELGKGVGDVVEATNGADEVRRLSVVGVGVLPAWNDGALGRTVALTAEGIDRNAAADPYDEVGLSTVAGVDPATVAADLAADYEVRTATMPRDAANLAEIDRVPLLLGLFLAALSAIMLGHGVVVTARRRHADLAALRAMGFTPRQSAISVLVMAATVALVASLLAIPLGVIVGGSVWRVAAEGAALLGDPAVRWPLVLAVVPATLLAGLAVALVPARRGGRPAHPSRTE